MRNLKYIAVLFLATEALAGANVWTTAGPPSVVNAAAVPPQAPARIYAAAADGFYRSPDEGRTWENVRGPLQGRGVLAVALAPRNGNRIYAGSSAGLFLSADAGSSWRQAAEVGPGVLAVAAGPEGRVYAGTFGRGVFSSLDSGATWAAGQGEMGEAIVFCLATTPLDVQSVYAGTASGLFVSRDAGRTWAALGEALRSHSVRAIHLFEDAGHMLAGTFGAGVFKSEDGGRTWAPLNTGLQDLAVRGLAVDAEGAWYAATSTRGFFRSRDEGRQWRALNEGLPGLAARSVLAHPTVAGRVLGSGPGSGVWEISLAPRARIQVGRLPLNFGTVAVRGQQTLRLRIANSGGATLSISRLSVGRPPLFAVAPTRLEVPPGGEASVELSFRPQARGVERDTLQIRSNDAEEGQIAIALQGAGVEAELAVSPAALNFGQVRLGGFRDTTVVLRNAGNAPLAVRNVFFDSSAFRVLNFQAQTLRTAESVLVRVRFQPARAGGVSGKLVVASDAPSRPRIEVAADGVGTAPELVARPQSLDFGSSEPRKARTLTLEISNSGNTGLTIQQFRLGGSSFRVEAAAPLALAPGEVQRLGVLFLPLHGGDHLDTLAILSDAAPGVLRVPLKGSSGALALRPRPLIEVGLSPADLLAVDLNRDGYQDLAAADAAGGRVQVLFNDGTGAFPRGRQASYPGPQDPAWDEALAMDAAALFGNEPDLIVADRAARSLSLLANDGRGGFGGRRQELFVGRAVQDVHAADLDADGDVDLAVADGDAPSITVFYNNGQGTFNARTAYPVDSSPVALSSANLDADGHRDLVVANRQAGTLSVLRNNRSGGFWPHQDYLAGLEPVALALVDYDADGDEDLLAANWGSRDVVALRNDGQGRFAEGARLLVQSPPAGLALSDLTADVFSDLVVVSGERPFGAFWENEAGERFTARDTLATDQPLRDVEILDFSGDGGNDVAVLGEGGLQVFINADTTRRQDRPRPPTQARAQDAPRDLGRRIEVLWEAPALDEQLGRTTEYTVFRSRSTAGPFAEAGRAVAGMRRFVDGAATLGDTFYYYVQAGNAATRSLPSDTVWASSQPSPFFELEVVDEARLSVGDTLKVRAFVTPAQHALAGISLYLSFADSALLLIPADTSGTAPFRPDSALGNIAVLENRLHHGAPHKIDVSLGELRLQPGVAPVLLGEVWFRTHRDTLARLAIDDEGALNRRSAMVEASTGAWILPFIGDTTRIPIRDFPVRGRVQPEGRVGGLDSLQITLSLVDEQGIELESPLNDEDRLRPGIQQTLGAAGDFHLAQIPRGRYRIFAKPPTHLGGQVQSDSVSVGDSLQTALEFRWMGPDSSSTLLLPAGDATDDNRINLADFGVLVRYFGALANRADWRLARQADFDGDRAVTTTDFFLLAQNFGKVGMGAGLLAPKEGSGWFWQEGGQVRIEGLGELSGFTALGPGLEASQEGTIWEGGELALHSWPEQGKMRLAGALKTGEARGEGVLFSLRGGQVEEVEVLLAGGQVRRLAPRAVRPWAFALLPNYPNPFNPSTAIPFAVGGAGAIAVAVRLEVFDLLGQRVRVLVDGELPPGLHRAVWDGRDERGGEAASGVYFYRLESGAFQQSRRLLLVR